MLFCQCELLVELEVNGVVGSHLELGERWRGERWRGERGWGERGRRLRGGGDREGGEEVVEEKYHLAGMVSSLNSGCQEEIILG